MCSIATTVKHVSAKKNQVKCRDGKPPLRAMSTEEVELHRHNLACVACDDC